MVRFLALVALLCAPAAAHAQLFCGRHCRPTATVAAVPGAAIVHPAASVSYTAYAMPVAAAPAPSCTGARLSYVQPSYAMPVQITSLAIAQPVTYAAVPMPAALPAAAPSCTGTAATSPGPTGDVNDSIVKLTAAVGQLTKIVSTHTDVLAEHQAALRAIDARTGALERRAGIAPALPVPKQ
jgi:hypothetical protein